MTAATHFLTDMEPLPPTGRYLNTTQHLWKLASCYTLLNGISEKLGIAWHCNSPPPQLSKKRDEGCREPHCLQHCQKRTAGGVHPCHSFPISHNLQGKCLAFSRSGGQALPLPVAEWYLKRFLLQEFLKIVNWKFTWYHKGCFDNTGPALCP